jgi:hypothetical protein
MGFPSTRALPDILWLLSSHRLTMALVVVGNRSNAPQLRKKGVAPSRSTPFNKAHLVTKIG